jgi:cytochrome P450
MIAGAGSAGPRNWRALHAFDWHGLHVDKGTWVLFDLYGTNHHPALWGDPEVFRPERFERRESSGFGYVPHGGGDPYSGHRCPGESVTADLVRSALRRFVEDIAYDVPPQDLTVGQRVRHRERAAGLKRRRPISAPGARPARARVRRCGTAARPFP